MKKYTVYMHTTPNGKRYIGITCKRPENRWQNGDGYKNQVFGTAILKYGWNNIKHEIIASGLSEEKAKCMEIELISKYKTQKPRYGYNCTAGGDGSIGCIPSQEIREKMSKAKRGKRLTEEHRTKIGAAQKGKCVSDETRAKISEASKGISKNSGRKLSDEHKSKLSEINKGKRLTEEHKKKISESLKGRQKSEETKLKLSMANKGKILSEETRAKLSESHKGKKRLTKGTGSIQEGVKVS